MDKEIFKPVKGYEEFYEISNIGRIKSKRFNKEKYYILVMIEMDIK